MNFAPTPAMQCRLAAVIKTEVAAVDETDRR